MSTQRHPLSDQELEQLSAYMDGALSDSEKNALEIRLNADSNLREEFEALRQTTQAIAALPKLRAPRNFTITHEMLGIKHPRKPTQLFFLPTTAAFSAMSAVASILFFIVGVSLLSNTLSSTPIPTNSMSSEIALAPTVTDAVEVQTQSSFAASEGAASSSAAGSNAADSELEGEVLRERTPDDGIYPAPIGGMAEFMATPAQEEAFLADQTASAYRANAMPESTEEVMPMLMQLPPMQNDDETADAMMPEGAIAASGIMQDETPEVADSAVLEAADETAAEASTEAVAEATQEARAEAEPVTPTVSQNDGSSIGGLIILLAALVALAIAILTTVVRLKNR